MVLAVIMWTLGGAVITFVVAAFVWVAILLMIKDTVKTDEKKMLVTLAVGSEEVCTTLARRLPNCPKLHRKNVTCPVDEILKYLATGNRVLLFIVQKELSGEVAELVTYLQTQVNKLYTNEPIDNKPLYNCIRYAVFGIGSTIEARDEFNRVAMKIDMNLRMLGATRVVPMRLYDSATCPLSVEEEFCQWFNDLAPETRLSSGPGESTRPSEEPVAIRAILAHPVIPGEEPSEDLPAQDAAKEVKKVAPTPAELPPKISTVEKDVAGNLVDSSVDRQGASPTAASQGPPNVPEKSKEVLTGGGSQPEETIAFSEDPTAEDSAVDDDWELMEMPLTVTNS